MKIKLLILIGILAVILLSCEGTTISSPKDIVFPDSKVSYLSHVDPFLRLTCGYAGCHGNYAAAGIILTDYFEIMKSPGLVLPGNPDQSYLIQIIEEKIPHTTYFERSQITANHIKGMRTWVKEGALNN